MVRNPSLRSDPDDMVEESSDTSDSECGCVLNGFTLCDKLQVLAKPQSFLLLLSLLGVGLGTAEKYFAETVLSSHFGVPYSIVRWLILGSEIGILLIVIPLIYFGSEKRRPGWLSGCFIFLSLGCILISTELLTKKRIQQTPDYFASNNWPNNNDNNDNNDVSITCQPWTESVRGKWYWYWATVILVVLLNAALGISRVAYWAFGITFLDDNATSCMNIFLIAVAIALRQFGPFIGSILSNASTTILIAGVLWLVLGILILFVSIFTGIFPKRLSGFTIHKTGDKGFLPFIKRVLSNKVIIFTGVAAICVETVIVNALLIEDRYVESVFYVSAHNTYTKLISLQYLFSLLKPTIAAISLVVSGTVIFQFKPRPVVLSIWSIVSLCITAGALFALIFFRCSATPIFKESSGNDLSEYCNRDCRCSPDIPFSPTCTPFYSYVFYSPCHAGCTASYDNGVSTLYTNCSCIPTGSAEVGHCNGGTCRVYWLLYQALTIVASAALASGFVGSILICLRSILPCDKTLIIGILVTLASFMARVPLKILYDVLANWTCLYYVDSHCKIYNSDKLTTYINLFHVILLVVAAGMLSITCFLVQDLQLYNYVVHTAVKSHSPEPVNEMSDFRSQLNQALKARKESVAEEQKLLSDSTRQSQIKGHENGNGDHLVEEERQRSSSFNNDKKMVTLPRPLIPVKPPVLKEVSTPTSSIISTPPETPTSPATPAGSPPGTTIKNQGYLTTLL